MAATISTCSAQLVGGRHCFQIADYSLNKGMVAGYYIRSSSFNVDGYEWSIKYYPDGFSRKSQKHISVFVDLMSPTAELRAIFGFRLGALNQQSQPSEWKTTNLQKVSVTADSSTRPLWGCKKFMERTLIDGSDFVRDDQLLIECCITVVKDPLVLENDGPAVILKLAPSELSSDLGKMIESREGADVTFFVKGETFPAHRAVLAVRSPVFRAQLFGPMMEKDLSCIAVEEIEPDVFKFLLHFIYTDTLLPLDGYDNGAAEEVIRHLLQAADRYAIERLKNLCEIKLCRSLDVETVARTLAIADQYQCNGLKQACLKYMVSPDKIDKVMASEEYNYLKRKFPNLLVEVLENVCKFQKMY